MYARIQTVDALPDRADVDAYVDRLVVTIPTHPGFAGLYGLRSNDTAAARLVTLWDSAEDAMALPDRTRAKIGPRPVEPDTDLIYEVRDDHPGVARDATPMAATMAWWPAMDEQTAAVGRTVRRERLAPAVCAVPGVVRVLALFQPDTHEPCALGLLTAPEVAEAVRAAVDAVELPADQRWTQSPDRFERYQVSATGAGRIAGAVT